MKNSRLAKYREKRDFSKTPEPRGKIGKKNNLTFVVQKHAASRLHYDLRLELNGVLLSFAVPKGPCLDPSIKRLAIHVEDHPLFYGNFEGTIPQGEYGGGTVMLWDKGTWMPEDKNPSKAWEKGHLVFLLKGKKLHGLWNLVRINKEEKSWLLIKGEDKYAKPLKKFDVTKKMDKSVKTNLSMNEITEKDYRVDTVKKIKLSSKKTAFPSSISPELATLVGVPPAGENWLHEIKLDGYRIIAFKKNKKVILYTRNKKDWTKKFEQVEKSIKNLSISNIILDGEIVVLNEKRRPDFQLLQNSIKNREGDFVYYIFDILYYENNNLTRIPLIQRKEILQELSKEFDNSILKYNDHVIGFGEKILKKACKLGMEGIVSKEISSLYEQKRTKSWLKSKCQSRQEFVIGGYTLPKATRKYFGSLLIGTYNKNKKLVYNGHVGTGFNQISLKDIYQQLKKIIVTQCPFTKAPKESKNAIWVEPLLVAEVEFTEWTSDNILRHPSFKGLRSDKPAKNIKKEIIKGK